MMIVISSSNSSSYSSSSYSNSSSSSYSSSNSSKTIPTIVTNITDKYNFTTTAHDMETIKSTSDNKINFS